MANLGEALDALLRARYAPGGIRRPVTHRQGLTARLNALQKQFPTQKALAASLGVSPRTIQRWRTGERNPSKKAQSAIKDAYRDAVLLPAARRRLKKLLPPNSVTITAVINWNGYKNRVEHRSTTLGGMRDTMRATIRAWFYGGPDAAADAFEAGVAQKEGVPVHFEGDDVYVSIPWEG